MKSFGSPVLILLTILGLTGCSTSRVPQPEAQNIQALAACRVECSGGTTPGGTICANMEVVPCEKTSANVVTSEVVLDPVTLQSFPGLDGKFKEAFGQGISTIDMNNSRLTIDVTDAYRASVGGEIYPAKTVYSAVIHLNNFPTTDITFTGSATRLSNGYRLDDISNLTFTKTDTLPSTGRIRTIFAEPDASKVSFQIANAAQTDLVAYSMDNSTKDLMKQGINGVVQPYMIAIEQSSNQYDQMTGQSVDPRCYQYGPPAPGSPPITCPNPLPPISTTPK